MKLFKNYLLIGLIGMGFTFTSCSEDDDVPGEENEEEVIDLVTLKFTDGDGNVLEFKATDSDGLGPEDFETETITLAPNTQYTLDIELVFTDENEDITEEIMEEDDEHMFFFGFTSDIFSSPEGDGNIGGTNRDDPMNYLDSDGTNPIGLETSWTTGDAVSDATFNVVLKHQPALTEGGEPQKSATSTSNTGESDIDIDFTINIET